MSSLVGTRAAGSPGPAAALARHKALAASVAAGLVSGGVLLGWGVALANSGLLLAYAVAIRRSTRRLEPAPGEPRRLRRDAAVVVVFLALAAALYLLVRRVGADALVSRGLPGWLGATGAPGLVADTAGQAVRNSALLLVPFLAAAVGLGLRANELGLPPRRLGLGLALTGAGVAVAAAIAASGRPSAYLFSPLGPPAALAVFALQAFVNGLPEELVFRGFLLSRLETLLRPEHALVLAAVVFNAAHLPALLAAGVGLPPWLLVPLGLAGFQPTGLAFGYLFQRTRSIWPGVLWHTSYMTLGAPFLG